MFSSYLLRLTQANSYTNYQTILDYVSIQSDLHKLNYLSKDTANLSLLSQKAELEEGQLWKMIFSEIGDREIRAYGSILDYEWLEREKVKICPTCFATDGYYHKHWSLWCYTSCHLHQCLLIDICPQCQSVWNWQNSDHQLLALIILKANIGLIVKGCQVAPEIFNLFCGIYLWALSISPEPMGNPKLSNFR